MTRIIIVCLFLLSVVSCTNTAPDKAAASSIAAVANTTPNNIVNVDDASAKPAKKAKCPCEGLKIEEGARGGHYCMRANRKGEIVKRYLEKGETSCK